MAELHLDPRRLFHLLGVGYVGGHHERLAARLLDLLPGAFETIPTAPAIQPSRLA